MIKRLEKSWLFISILLVLVLVACLFFWKSVTLAMSRLVVGLSIVAASVIVIRREVQAQKEGKITRTLMWRNIVVDVLGILVSMAAVIWVAGMIASAVVQAVGKAWGATAGILSALVAGLVVGVIVSLFVRWFWGLVTRQIRITPAKSNV